MAQAAGPADRAAHRGAHRLLGADDPDELGGPGDRRVQQLPGEQRGLRRRQHDRDPPELAALPAVDGVLVADEQASTIQAVVEFVESNTLPGEPIFVYPSSPMVYVMANRPNPTRFGHLYPGAASIDELRRVMSILDQTPVRVVVVSYSELSFWGPPAQNEALEAYLSLSYHEAARFREYRVFVRNP